MQCREMRALLDSETKGICNDRRPLASRLYDVSSQRYTRIVMSKKSPPKGPPKKNIIAKDLRTPKYKMRVVKDKKRETKTRPKTQKEMREELDKDRRCTCPWCPIAKEPWQHFCWAHYWDLPSGYRISSSLETKDLKRVLRQAVKLLRDRRNESLKHQKEVDKWVKEQQKKNRRTKTQDRS